MTDLRFPGRSDMLGTISSAEAEDVAVNDLVDRLKKDVFRSRLRLREFFKDFDSLRSGVITAAKFRTALEISGLVLSDPELTKLSRHYADPLDPLRVRYEPLLSEIAPPEAALPASVATAVLCPALITMRPPPPPMWYHW